MDAVAQFAIDLLKQKIDTTKRVLPPGRTVTVDASSICQDLERIVAQIEHKAEVPEYIAPQMVA